MLTAKAISALLFPNLDHFTVHSIMKIYSSGSREISPELQAAEVDVIDNRQCDGLLRPSCNRLWCGIQETQICAGKLAGGVDACQVRVNYRIIRVPKLASDNVIYLLSVRLLVDKEKTTR